MPQKKTVLICGAGAAGMSAAYAFSLKPEEFEVTLVERSSYTGGMATSTEIDEEVYGANYFNDGVQGASPTFANTYKLFESLGFFSAEVGMTVSFGNENTGDFWTNSFPTATIDKYSKDIAKFDRVLKIIKTFEPIFALISVQAMLKLFGFRDGFGETIVFPLTALFFGTGNQTPFVSSAILERVFKDPSMKLFEYSPTSFLASIPIMRAFPRLSLLYSTWATLIQSNKNVKILTSHELLSIDRSKSGVKVQYRPCGGTNLDQEVITTGGEPIEANFDEIILCCDADASLKLLGNGATWLERKALGNVKYLSDISITHSDEAYMKKYYHTTYDPSTVSKEQINNPEVQAQLRIAEKSFLPLYFIRSYPSDKKKVEMSFDLTNYQPQFKGYSPQGIAPSSSSSTTTCSGADGEASGSESGSEMDKKIEKKKEFKHVYQTIFLDREGSEALWTRNEINKDEIILEKWWKQQSHRWQHYGGTVPLMAFINGKNRTHFAGAWSILNMHEIALVSGFAAAYKLGAPYPFVEDKGCKRLFGLYLFASHLTRMRAEDRSGFLM